MYVLWPIFFQVTGHSLGGSMASICAGVLSKLEIWPKNQIKLITFGQPRTGDMPYAAAPRLFGISEISHQHGTVISVRMIP